MSKRLFVQCPECWFVYFQRPECPRCRKAMPPSVINVVEHIVLGAFLDRSLPLLTMEKYEKLIVTEALRRGGNPNVAGKLLGMGKTTAYREAKEWGLTW